DAAAAKKTVADLAGLPAPPGAPPQILRRVSLLRCTAARLLAGASYGDKGLGACDVAPGGGIGARPLVAVLGQGEPTGARLPVFRERAREGDARAREAALELLEQHEEVEGAPAILAEALAAKEIGVASTAAQVIAKQPQRALEERAAPRKGKRKKKKVD